MGGKSSTVSTHWVDVLVGKDDNLEPATESQAIVRSSLAPNCCEVGPSRLPRACRVALLLPSRRADALLTISSSQAALTAYRLGFVKYGHAPILRGAPHLSAAASTSGQGMQAR